MRECVLTRHGESEYNVSGRLNGDPGIDVALSPRGREEARELGLHVAATTFDLCLHTRFPRTLATARLALAVGCDDVALGCEPLLDDIDVGDFEGCSYEEYVAWKHGHPRDEPLPGGESLRSAAQRYARALHAIAVRPEERILVVCHELPLRSAINAGLGSDDLASPVQQIANATPYLFDADRLTQAAARIDALAAGPWGIARPKHP